MDSVCFAIPIKEIKRKWKLRRRKKNKKFLVRKIVWTKKKFKVIYLCNIPNCMFMGENYLNLTWSFGILFVHIHETATIRMTSANFLRYVNEIHFLKFTVLFICKCTRADFMGFFIFLPNWMILACKHGMVPESFKSIKTFFHHEIMLGISFET